MTEDKKAQDFVLKEKYSFDELLEIMAFLRGPEGCPWDQKQTHESIKGNMVEEAWETVDAINSGHPERISDELGDVLLQVVFHSQMAKEAGNFDVNDVISNICRKLISRHTHIFGKDQVNNAEESLATWEANKRVEKGLKSETDVLREVPLSLPALTRAYKVQKKAANCGFDWPNVQGALDKIGEEAKELSELIQVDAASGNVTCRDLSGTRTRDASGVGSKEALCKARLEEEGGDLLFAVVNTLRHLKIDPELALTRASDKFISRFANVEAQAKAEGKEMRSMNIDELDALWDRAKEKERE